VRYVHYDRNDYSVRSGRNVHLGRCVRYARPARGADFRRGFLCAPVRGWNTLEFITGIKGDIMQYVNEEEKFWRHSYLVSFDNHTGWDSAICVNAENEQDAIDAAADYAESQGWMGYFLDADDVDKMTDAEQDDLYYAGNHGLPIDSEQLNVKQLD
jgi:hypothetical protein